MWAAFLFAALFGASLSAAAEAPPARALIPGHPAKNAINRGESHRYHLALPAGHCARIRLRQYAIDVWLKADSPSGATVLDLNWEKWGDERYTLCADTAGHFLLVVQAATDDSNHGSYVLTVYPPRPSQPAQREAMQAQALTSKAIQARTDTQSLETALDIFRKLGDRWAEMKARSHLARAHHRRGEYGPTAKHQKLALNLARKLGDRFEHAISTRELFRVYGHLGEQRLRLAARRETVALLQTLGDPRATAAADAFLAGPLYDQRRYAEALPYHVRLLASYQALGLPDDSRDILPKLARIHAELRRPEEAVSTVLEYLNAQKATGLIHHQAAGYFTVGKILQDCGRFPEAETHYQTAAALYRMMGDKSAEASCQNGIAECAARRGDLHQALRRFNWSIRLWDDVKLSAGSLKWSAGMENRVRARQKVSILLALHRQEPSARYAEQSLETWDGTRAKYLEAGPSTISEMQNLAGDHSLLLEFLLTPRRSILWALDGTALQIFELPGEEVLQPLFDRYRTAVASRSHRQASESAQQYAARVARADKTLAQLAKELGHRLLSPAAHLLGDRKLLIVPDGPLEQLPFAALKDPVDPGGRPVGQVREVAYLPSASSVLALRRNRDKTNPSPPAELAVLADPVFRKNDPRLDPAGAGIEISKPLQAATRALGLKEIPRLLYSRIEGESVAAYARNPVLMFDFDASRDAFLSGRLNGIRIVHFAAHGFSNLEDPDLSGLVLSLVDRAGKPRDGFLRFQDVYNHQLVADLVVLSACQTAVGKTFQESGVMSLSGAFLHAGTARVLSTLWKIDDEATAEFMEIFYRELLSNQRPPSAALRIAQAELARNPRWSSPYFWAGFIVQGWPH